MEVFKIYCDQIKDRLDPLFLKYKLSPKKKANYLVVKLKELLLASPQYGANERAIDFKKGNIRYIRITDIDKNGNLKKEKLKSAETTNPKYILNPNDILFARSGATAGKAFIFNENMQKSIFAGYLIRFTFNKEKVNPKYIFYYSFLSQYKSWVASIQRAAGQPNINSEEYKNLELPLPSIDIQNSIVNLLDTANNKKEKYERKADNLLLSIDNYILEQLRISLPESSNEKTFSVFAHEVEENRIDPYYYQSEFLAFDYEIKHSKYESVLFEDVISSLINGLDSRDFKESGTPYLKVANIKPFKIDLSKEYFINMNVNTISKNINLRKDNLLLTRKGTFGVAVRIKDNNDYIICSEIFKITTKGINTEYLTLILNSSIGQRQFDRLKIGAIMGSLSQDAVRSVLIPLPPIDIQHNLASEVSLRIERAEKLKKKAIDVIKKARKEVEYILFGD